MTAGRFDAVERFFLRHGGKTILIGRFIGFFRSLGPFVAGSARVPYGRFLAASLAGAGLWSAVFVALGYVFYRSFHRALHSCSRGTRCSVSSSSSPWPGTASTASGTARRRAHASARAWGGSSAARTWRTSRRCATAIPDPKGAACRSTSTTSRRRSCRRRCATFARICTSLIEEAEAIGWYEQRLAVEKDHDARAIMEHAQQEEFLHFSMDLEFLARRKDAWRIALKDVLFKKGDIVAAAEKAEAEQEAE